MQIITKITDIDGSELSNFMFKYRRVHLELLDVDTMETETIYCNSLGLSKHCNIMGYNKENGTYARITYNEYLLSTCLDYISMSDGLSIYLEHDVINFCTFTDGIYGNKRNPTVMNYILECFKKQSKMVQVVDNQLYVYIHINTFNVACYVYEIVNMKLFSKLLLLS